MTGARSSRHFICARSDGLGALGPGLGALPSRREGQTQSSRLTLAVVDPCAVARPVRSRCRHPHRLSHAANPFADNGPTEEVRPRRRDDAGQHFAHRRPPAPAAARRQRASPCNRGCSPAPIRTRRGGAPRLATSCARCCASTAPDSWRPLPRQRHQLGPHRRPPVLAIVPTPAATAKLTTARITVALRRGGRIRETDQLAARLHEAPRRPHLRQDPWSNRRWAPTLCGCWPP